MKGIDISIAIEYKLILTTTNQQVSMNLIIFNLLFPDL